MGIYNSRRIEDIPLKSAEDLLNLKLIWDQSLNHKVEWLSKTTHLSKVVAFIKNNYLKRFSTNIAHIEMFILFCIRYCKREMGLYWIYAISPILFNIYRNYQIKIVQESFSVKDSWNWRKKCSWILKTKTCKLCILDCVTFSFL